MKRLILVPILLIVLLFLAAPTWRVTVKVERPGSIHADSMRVHHAKHDSVQADVWFILRGGRVDWREVVDNSDPDNPFVVLVPDTTFQSIGIEGWAIIDNASGTQYVVTAPDTIPIIGPIRSALGKYNQYVTVRKVKVD